LHPLRHAPLHLHVWDSVQCDRIRQRYPYWSKTVKLKYSTINADADKLTTSGVWREPFRHRRCLVPADLFLEWAVVDNEKQARAFRLKDDSPFAFAGIWDHWKDKETGDVLESFAIVTADPSEWMV